MHRRISSSWGTDADLVLPGTVLILLSPTFYEDVAQDNSPQDFSLLPLRTRLKDYPMILAQNGVSEGNVVELEELFDVFAGFDWLRRLWISFSNDRSNAGEDLLFGIPWPWR